MSSNNNINFENMPIGASPEEFNAWLAAQGSQQATQSIPLPTAEENLAHYQQIKDAAPLQTQSVMQQPTGNLLANLRGDAQEIGTGIGSLWANKGDLPQAIMDYAQTNPDYLKDFVNANLSTYNLATDDFGTLGAGEIAQRALQGAWENPLYAGIDLASLGLFRGIGKALPWTRNATKVEQGVNVTRSEVASRGERLYQKLGEATKLADDTGADLGKVVEAMEAGSTVTGVEKSVLKKLREFSDEYDSFLRDYSPATYVGAERTAITQKILRDRMKVDPTTTFAQVERDITPLMERMAAEGVDSIKALAREGNITAKEIVGAKSLYDKGRIKPITHGLAGVDRTIAEQVQRVGSHTPDIFTRRAYGNSTYADIAAQLRKPEEFLEGVIASNVQKAVARDLLNGKVGGQAIVEDGSRNLVYLNRELLERGDLKGALTELRKKQTLADDIVVDKYFAQALKDQMDIGGALQGFAKDLYNTGKGVLMAAGGYLGPNFLTGAANAIINSNVHILDDVIAAIQSQGRLSKNLGTYRRANLPNYSVHTPLRELQKFNRMAGGGLFQRADRAMQNIFSEIAANAELRKLGVNSGSRLDYISQMDKMKLGEVITDIKRTSLINSPNVPLPKPLQDVAFVLNPFWRWQATAAQSGLRMLEKNPLLANVALVDIMSNIGFDKEMQRRLNLNVTLDKPFVSFRINQYTGQTEQVSAETVPMTTTLKLLFGEPSDMMKPTIPAVSAIINALGGKDKYGRPITRPDQNGIITRTVGTKRYRTNPVTGQLEEVRGGYGDEVLTAAIKDLVGLPTLANRTIGPIASYFIGDGQFYQPFGSSVLGSFERSPEGNIVVGGNPERGRTIQQVMEGFGGMYATPYYPTFAEEGRPISQRIQRQFYRNLGRRDAEIYQGQ